MNNFYAIGFHNGEICLMHYRTPGSKNGVRRYQNEDGSLTPEGYLHYGIDPNTKEKNGTLTNNQAAKRLAKDFNKSERLVRKDQAKLVRSYDKEYKKAEKLKNIHDKNVEKTAKILGPNGFRAEFKGGEDPKKNPEWKKFHKLNVQMDKTAASKKAFEEQYKKAKDIDDQVYNNYKQSNENFNKLKAQTKLNIKLQEKDYAVNVNKGKHLLMGSLLLPLGILYGGKSTRTIRGGKLKAKVIKE